MLSWNSLGLYRVLNSSCSFFFSLSISALYSPSTATFWPEWRKAEPKDSPGWGAGIGNRLWVRNVSFVGRSSSFLPCFWNLSHFCLLFCFLCHRPHKPVLPLVWAIISLFKDYLLRTNCILTTSYFSLKQHNNFADYVLMPPFYRPGN